MTEDRRLVVKEADTVAFDLFDTLFVRSVARAHDAFRLAQELVNVRSDWYLTQEFGPLRVAAELALREEAVASGGSADAVTMDHIYRRVEEAGGLVPELTVALMAAELDAERLLLRPTELVDVLRFAVDQGKDVVVASDTYLPRPFVEELLASVGVAAGYDLWLSCERGASKADGSLWAALVASRKGRGIVHFGDNPVSDVGQGTAFGVTVHPEVNRPLALREGAGAAGALGGQWLFRHLEVDGFRLKNLHRSLIGGVVANRLAGEPPPAAAYALGYGAFGPLLLGHVQWLHRAACAAGHDQLFFLARDGRVMQEAYRAFWGEDALPSTYVLASRRLLRLPAIGAALTNRDVDFLTQTSWPMTAGEYFTRLGIPGVGRAAMPLLEQAGIDPEEPGEPYGAELRAIFWQLADLLVEAASGERQMLTQYWETAGLLAATHPALVDIGWHGSLQRAVRRVLDHAGFQLRMAGLYFGLHPQRPRDPSEPMQAFVDGADPGDADLYQRLVVGAVAPLEFCFTGRHGTVVGLERTHDAVVPGSEPGTIVGRFAEDRLTAADADILDEVQRGAVDFVRDFRSATTGMPGTVTFVERDVATESMSFVLTAPTAMAADVLGRRSHSDGFGHGVAWKRIGAPVHDRSWYEEDPQRLADELADSDWRAGYVANARALGLPAN